MLPAVFTELTPDLIMRREALCGASIRGPTTVTVLWPLTFSRGYSFSMPLCKRAIEYLTDRHPNLRTAFVIQGAEVKWFELHSVQVPITEYIDDKKPDCWRSTVKSELRKPFDNPNLPAWRVAVVLEQKEEKETRITMLFTALHALCDGVCLAQLAVEFNETMAKLHLGIPIPKQMPEHSPPLELLFDKFPNIPEPVPARLVTSQEFHPCETGFAIHAFTQYPGLVEALKAWCRDHQLKVHGALAAALIKAVKEVRNPPDSTYESLSIVSFRDALGVSKKLIRPLFSWLKVEAVDPSKSFLEIATMIHNELHEQLDSGKHVENLMRSAAQLRNNPTPEDLLSQISFPPNLVNLTNRQELGSCGKYPEQTEDTVMSMDGIYGFGGNSPYFGLQGPGGFGPTIGVTTFRGKFFCSASFIEDTRIGLGEEMAERVLKAMEAILIKEVRA